jgi:hypothetical protein
MLVTTRKEFASKDKLQFWEVCGNSPRLAHQNTMVTAQTKRAAIKLAFVQSILRKKRYNARIFPISE